MGEGAQHRYARYGYADHPSASNGLEAYVRPVILGAVGMFPRLAFVTLSNNLMILSLR